MLASPVPLTQRVQPFLVAVAQFWCNQRGRWAAMLVLLTFSVPFFCQSWSPLQSLRHRQFDWFQTMLPRAAVAEPVRIVAIDEQSLAALGQWPWPRNYLSALVDSIQAMHPAAIGLDILMPEADHASPEAVAESRADLPAAVRQAMLASPTNDHLLSQSLAASPSVLGVAGLAQAMPLAQTSLRSHPILQIGTPVLPRLDNYAYVLTSMPDFQQAATGMGLLSARLERGVLRQVSVLNDVHGTVQPHFALELLRVARQVPALQVTGTRLGVAEVQVGSLHVPLQADGSAWLYFDRPDRRRYLSALQVFRGEVAPAQLAGQIVVIGLTGLGLQDMVTTPHGDRRPGVESHAQWLEAAIHGQSLLRPVWMPALEWLLMSTLAAGLIWYVTVGMPARSLAMTQGNVEAAAAAGVDSGIAGDTDSASDARQSGPYLRPSQLLSWLTIMAVLVLCLGMLLFASLHWLFDSLGILLALAAVMVSLYLSSHLRESRERKRTEQALLLQRLQAERVRGEMEAASKIQLSTLPDPRETFPAQEQRFQIAAWMQPVRHVGGDLYDFFMCDARHLFFVIGDVSGKGMPASLMMVVTKALMKNAVLRLVHAQGLQEIQTDIAEIVATVNTEICRENPQMLFVTGIAGLLDLQSGRLALVNAGHDAPWLIADDGAVTRVEGEGNPPLGVMEDMPFSASLSQLPAQAMLYMVTDGVTEAMDAAQGFFTVERVTDALANCQPTARSSPDAMLGDMRAGLVSFVGQAEQADDITMLAIRWMGVPASESASESPVS